MPSGSSERAPWRTTGEMGLGFPWPRAAVPVVVNECPECKGRRRVTIKSGVSVPCPACGGSGVARTKKGAEDA